MKLNKGLALIIVVVMLLSVLAACTGNAPANENAEWTITVEGAGKAAFTSVDYDKLTKTTIDAVQKKKDGSEQQQKWEGVLLKDVLASLGVTDYSSITLTASDDYSKDYTPDIVNDAQTVLGTVMNGTALGKDNGYVEAVAGSQPGNMWIKNLVKITVNK